MSMEIERRATEDPRLNHAEWAGLLEPYRVELVGYCYRMLGSVFEAEDAVQDTMIRAGHGFGGFDPRGSVRSWLYRIATHVCLSAVRSRKRRVQAMDLGPAARGLAALGPALDHAIWLEPIPDHLALPAAGDPSEHLIARETIRLAFVAGLQLLPPRQRAALILHDVLQWPATEVAELLSSSVAAIHAALQRARSALAERNLGFGARKAGSQLDWETQAEPETPAQRLSLARYVEAVERCDMDALGSLLHEDATQSMPPYALWLQGPAEIRRWFEGPTSPCQGSRLVPVRANGCPAYAQYRPRGRDGVLVPFAIHVLELAGDRILSLTSFLDTERFFPLYGLARRVDSVEA